MRLIHRDDLRVVPFPTKVDYPRDTVSVVVKTAVKLVHGGVAELLSEQPYSSGDIPYADDEQGLSSPRYESDLAPFKPKADVMVVGSFHPPAGRKVSRSKAEIAVGRRRHLLSIHGRRVWDLGLLRASISEPEPLGTVPLRWENAFGGPEHESNPVGKGHITKSRKRAGTPIELPMIEWSDQPIKSPADVVIPAGCAPTSRLWKERSALIGTFDENWEQQRWPFFPEDFDWAHYQAAPAQFQYADYLSGDESLFFRNLHPDIPEYETRLPDLRAVAAVQRGHGSNSGPSAIQMNLDTLWVDMDAEQAVLIWRGVCATVDEDMSDIEYMWADVRPGTLPSDAETQHAATVAIAAWEAEWVMEEETPPPAPIVEEATPTAPPAELTPQEMEIEETAAQVGKIAADAAAALEQLGAFELGPTQQALIAAETLKAEADVAAEASASDDETSGSAWNGERVRENDRSGTSLADEDLSGADFTGEDLSGVDLSGADLTGACFRGANLEGAKLVGSQLEKANLTEARLVGAQLDDAVMCGAICDRADASGCAMTNANLADSSWEHASLDGADLSGVDGPGASFCRARMKGAKLLGASFDGACFDEADVSGAQAAESTFENASMQSSLLNGADFLEAEMSGAGLEGASLEGANLTDATIEGARAGGACLNGATVKGLRAGEKTDLTGASLDGIEGADPIFTDAQLVGASMKRARVPGADFSGANLREASIDGCDLIGARFVAADLTAARLMRSNCFEALFERARLEDTDGSDSSFYGAEFLDADTRRFRGKNRFLASTKIAGSAES